MNEQENIQQLIYLKNDLEGLKYNSCASKRMEEALKMAIKALKKQIGLKPLENIVCFYCPKCKHFVESVYNYCGFCGQKLDWTVEE